MLNTKKRKLDQTTEEDCEDAFPYDFNICYSTDFLNRKAVELVKIRKEIVTKYYRTLDEGNQVLTIDVSNYNVKTKQLIIEEICARFPKIVYTINNCKYSISGSSSFMDIEHCINAVEFQIPLTSIADIKDDKMDSYIS